MLFSFTLVKIIISEIVCIVFLIHDFFTIHVVYKLGATFKVEKTVCIKFCSHHFLLFKCVFLVML